MQSPPDHEDEVKFAKALVNPEKESRDKTLAKLRKYVASIKTFDDMEMLKLWKALYYTMWLSDKQPIQLELAQNLTDLTHVFSTVELQLLYVRMFFRILMREWFHLDQYRVNKFYSLIRLMFRNVLATAAKAGWESEITAQLISIVDEEVLTKKPNGVRFHIADIVLPELYNVTSGKITTKDFLVVFRPFLDSVLRLDDNNVYIERVYKEVLHKYASDFAAENASEETTTVFADVNTKVLQKIVFELASEEETPNVCRKKLYDLHKAFAATTKLQFVSESVEALLAAEASQAKSAVKKDKKKVVAAAPAAVVETPKVPEPVPEKTSKKEKKGDKAEKKAEKAPEAVPVAAEKSEKKKNKRSASELAEESEPVPVPTSKKDKDAAEGVKKVKTPKTTEETPAVTKSDKSDKAEKSDKPKEKKAKTEKAEVKEGAEKSEKSEKKDKSAVAEAEAAKPKVDTPPPQFIASAKFAGRKIGYAFKKGKEGLGYYWDAVQARKLARGSVAGGSSATTPSKFNSSAPRTPSAGSNGSAKKHSAGSNGKNRR